MVAIRQIRTCGSIVFTSRWQGRGKDRAGLSAGVSAGDIIFFPLSYGGEAGTGPLHRAPGVRQDTALA